MICNSGLISDTNTPESVITCDLWTSSGYDLSVPFYHLTECCFTSLTSWLFGSDGIYLMLWNSGHVTTQYPVVTQCLPGLFFKHQIVLCYRNPATSPQPWRIYNVLLTLGLSRDSMEHFYLQWIALASWDLLDYMAWTAEQLTPQFGFSAKLLLPLNSIDHIIPLNCWCDRVLNLFSISSTSGMYSSY